MATTTSSRQSTSHYLQNKKWHPEPASKETNPEGLKIPIEGFQ